MKMNERSFKTYFTILLLTLFGVVPKEFANAQEISLEIEPSATLENAQVLSLTNLGIDTKGSGPVLISAFLENLTDRTIDNLYIEVFIRASKVGTIVELTQRSSRPFSLKPSQSIYATNNDLANEAIPGIEEKISFSGGLTSQGEDFLGDLSSGTTLPRDVYTVEVVIFRVTDAEGRRDLARDVAEIGGASATSFDESSIYLKTPGDVIGDEAEITNPYPQFSWEGSSNTTYRLLVVKDNDQDSPESLLQSARSSLPLSEGGSLLQYENLDALVDETTFQFPSSGTQPLERGETYYWQVLTTVQTGGDTEEISSEIWEFKMADATEAASTPPFSNEIERALIELMGEDGYRTLEESGFTFESIEYDGQQFTGAAASVKLEELLQKIRDEEIILGDN